MKEGDKIHIKGEIKPYIVKAIDEKFAICTKNMFGNTWYFIIDRVKRIRGVNNKVFNPYDYSIQEDIDKCLQDLNNSECEVSGRNFVKLEETIDC